MSCGMLPTLDSNHSNWRQYSRSVRSGTFNRQLFVTLHDTAVVPENTWQGAGEPVQLWQPEASAQLAGSAQPRDAQSARAAVPRACAQEFPPPSS